MTRPRWTYLLILVALQCSSVASIRAQSTASTTGQAGTYTVSIAYSQDSLLIGDPLEVRYTIRAPKAITITSLDLSPLDSTVNLVYGDDTPMLDQYMDWGALPTSAWKVTDDIIPAAQWNTGYVNDEQIIEGSITIAIYSVGVFAINDLSINADRALERLPLQRPTVMVLPPASATTGAAEQGSTLAIKDIIREQTRWTDYLPILYVLLGIALLVLVVRYLRRRSGAAEPVVPPPTPVVPAYEWAIEQLAVLDQQQLWQRGEVKDYQSRLTGIVREYLERRYDIAALEMTTGEIVAALANTDFEQGHTSTIQRLLQMADLVKFAKAQPDVSIHETFMTDARAFVHDTRPLPTPDQNES